MSLGPSCTETNASNRCPMKVDCCVAFFLWGGLRRLPLEPGTLPGGYAPTHLFYLDRGGYQSQQSPRPCNYCTPTSLCSPSANLDEVVDCCVVFVAIFPSPSPGLSNLFIQKACELGFMGQINYPRPSSTGHNGSPTVFVCCVVGFGWSWGRRRSLGPSKTIEEGTPARATER